MPNKQRTRTGASDRRRTHADQQTTQSDTRWELFRRLRRAGSVEEVPGEHGSHRTNTESARSVSFSEMPVCVLGPGGCYGSSWPRLEVDPARNPTPESAARPVAALGRGFAGVCRWLTSFMPPDWARSAELRVGRRDLDLGEEFSPVSATSPAMRVL